MSSGLLVLSDYDQLMTDLLIVDPNQLFLSKTTISATFHPH